MLISILYLVLVFGYADQPNYPTPSEVRTAFLKQLDRPKVPLDVKIGTGDSLDGGVAIERLTFATQAKTDGGVERVTALIARPVDQTKKHPSVLMLHGTGGSKDAMKAGLIELAKLGFVAVAIDGRYHGDRNLGATGTDAYNAAIAHAWRSKPGEPREYPFYFDTCWDLWRTLDYVQTRTDVDPDRIGMIGFSKGGIETWLAASVDERVKVAIPAISVQSFAWGLENNAWQGRAATIKQAHNEAAKDLGAERVDAVVCRTLWDKVIPGMTSQYDCPSMLRLFAGRPVLILNGSNDPNCPIGGAKVAFESAKVAYHAVGADDKLEINVAEGIGHAVTPEQRKLATAWLVKWLKP